MKAREHMLNKAAKTAKGRERVRALLEHAIDVFIDSGFEGASVDRIVRMAGGSKSTVYHSFGSKKGLFLATLEMMADDLYEACIADYQPGRTLLEDLHAFGGTFLRGILAPRSIALMRLVYAQASRVPEVGAWFYQGGIEASYLGFAKVLENHIDAPLKELEEVAALFLEALRGRLFQKALCLPEGAVREEEIEADLALGIDFVSAYIREKYAGRLFDAASAHQAH